MSLSRIPLGLLVGYCLWRDEPTATIIAIVLFILAGATDALDGFLARRAGQVTTLGIALDPIADKVFAGLVTAGLILFREFPLWLAAMIIGRDLLILGLGRFLVRGRDISLPSNLIGKWTFGTLAILLGAYVIRFEFSITMMTPVVVGLLIASAISYGRVFLIVRSGGTIRPFDDRIGYRIVRYSLLAATIAAHAIMFYREFMR
jgi:CDP-diacylglycerol--glycerol-3-phosphate 3-phosphatidyltransferase